MAGDIAKELAAAPLPEKKEKRVNAFLKMYPLNEIIFESDVQDPSKPWSNGTTSQTLAQARLHFAGSSAFLSGARIVRLKASDGSARFTLQMPSTPRGPVRMPVIATPDDESKRDLAEYCTAVTSRWIELRKAEVKAGTGKAIKTAAVAVGVSADAALTADLGID